jgi:ATP-dependent DNA ligase
MASQDFEGIVAKRLDSPYKAGRQPTWLKIKNPGYSRKEALGYR